MNERATAFALRLLVVVASLGLCGTALFAIAWWRAGSATTIPIETLSDADRRRLTSELLAVSPGIFRPSLVNPEIGYTLEPGRQVDAWGDTFTSNELGYRTGPVAKARGVRRLVFVGDSWTFGLGVRESDAFPRRLEHLARQRGVEPVEAWSLALPGYNLLNQVAALETFADLIEPDAVVFCPSVNDINSSQVVLPNGSLGHAGQLVDDFGSRVVLELRSRTFDSELFHRRWRRAMTALAGAEGRFASRGVPTVVFFTGPWIPSLAHRLAADARLVSPYLVTPPELTGPRWLNPPPWRHPNPEAHALYAGMIYRALAGELGWPELEGGGADDVPVHRVGDRGGDWLEASDRALREQTARQLSRDFVPGRPAEAQLVSGIDVRTGLMARSGAVFLDRDPGGRRLRIELRRVVDGSWLYPLGVTVTIPSPSGGASERLEVAEDGPARQSFAVDLPGDLGAAVDVLLEAEGVGVNREGVVPWSVEVVRVSQLP